MRPFVWILPIILLVAVVVMGYLLEVAQDKASKTATNQSGLRDIIKVNNNNKSISNTSRESPYGLHHS